MRVKFKAIDAGPAGVRLPGSVVEVDNAEGRALIEGGFAELVEDAKPKARSRKDDEAKKADDPTKDDETGSTANGDANANGSPDA